MGARSLRRKRVNARRERGWSMIAYLAEARRGRLYTCVLRASRVESESDGECSRTTTMMKEILLNWSQVRDIEREGEEEATTFDGKAVKANVKANGGG